MSQHRHHRSSPAVPILGRPHQQDQVLAGQVAVPWAPKGTLALCPTRQGVLLRAHGVLRATIPSQEPWEQPGPKQNDICPALLGGFPTSMGVLKLEVAPEWQQGDKALFQGCHPDGEWVENKRSHVPVSGTIPA